ncbi:MAG: DegV family EDD domain-containing protein [Candidatus Aminicenantes bacterium]|nr:DegV family EDD domain-containing protein [Candidatus Aminicenantes bacterium]
MKIKYLNGNRLYYAFLAGGNAVIEDQAYLNKINVFPVPDSDTGTNLASTMRSIADGASVYPSTKETLHSIADSALNGARGNSGIIFAQFIYGISREIKEDLRISTKVFGALVKAAAQHAYKSVADPVEGTMLTVMKDWAEAVYQYGHRSFDFVEVFSRALKTAEMSLKNTPKKLSVLARAGVVDAGAKGFVDFLEGIVHFIKAGRLKVMFRKEKIDQDTGLDVHSSWKEGEKRYCSEALLSGIRMNLDELRMTLNQYGTSVIVAGSEQKARIHVHTDSPQELFFELKKYGDTTQIKVDDMKRQYEAGHQRISDIALVVDSACDLPDAIIENFQVHVIPMSILIGENQFLDKVTITPGQFYSLLLTEKRHPTSAIPSQKQVENLLSFLSTHYENIIVVNISSKLSGMYDLCCKAAERVNSHKFSVVDSKNLSASEGLLVLRIAEAIQSRLPIEEIVKKFEEWTLKTKLLVDIATLKYMVRGGRVSPLKGFIAKMLNIKPVITLDEKGAADSPGKSFSRKGNMKKILKIVEQWTQTERVWKYALVHAQNPGRAAEYAERLTAIIGKEPAYTVEVSPVVGVHNGIGVVGISIMFE